ncbi:insulin growth factor-like family member 1 [Sorex araneus]|uniref:insulin growth factor-like family member 1 n=1 Tax=Sorex araneus TaxID=42254 RepID=UPI0003314411|nr:insulin growth factor-like family member 1 [Sorex araneus]
MGRDIRLGTKEVEGAASSDSDTSTVLLITVCSLAAFSTLGVPVSPKDSHWLLCQSQERCGGKSYDPLNYCCHDQAVVPLSRSQGCGNCTFRVCFEQCCPGRLPDVDTLVVKIKGHSCSSDQTPGDRVCHSIKTRT